MQKDIFMIFIIFIIILQNLQCETKNQDQILDEIQLTKYSYKQWKKITNLTTFQSTIEAFPQLIENMQIRRTIQLLEKGGCMNSWGDEPARYIIVDNQIYVYGSNKDYQRARQYKIHLDKISKKKIFPDMYFILDYLDAIFPQLLGQDHLEQCKKIPSFVFNKNYSDEYSRSKFLLPDTYIIQPNWQDLIDETKKASQQFIWNKKIPKLFFRGIPSGPHKYRFKLDSSVNFSKYFHRAALVNLGLQHPDIIDAKFSKDPGPLSDQLQRRVGNQTQIFTYKVVSFTEHIKYKYLFSADGRGTAWKRLAFILFSNSLLVKPFSQQIQWFYDKIIPFTHFLQIKDDLSDLFKRLENIKKNESKALQMIKNANKIANEYLTPEAISNYTYNTLIKYAKIQNLKLNQDEKNDIKNGIDAQLVLKLKTIKEEWDTLPKMISFQQTLNAFPFLKQNMNILKMNDLIQAGGCGISLAKFFILENTIYCQGQVCNQNQSKNIKKLFQRIKKKRFLPDMYLIIAINNLQAFKISKELQNLCKAIPIFTFKKNISCPIEQTKFLLPNPQDEINKITFLSNEWRYKIDKVYLQWMISDQKQINQNKLLQLFRKYPDLIELKLIADSKIESQNFQKIQKLFGRNKILFQSTSQQIKLNYKYLFISDRFKNNQKMIPHILYSQSILLKPLLSQRFEWFYQNLIPGVHFISLREDVSDLLKTVSLLSKNQERAKKIVKQAQIFAQRYLTAEKIDDYIIEVLLKYSQIQNLEISQQSKQLIKLGVDLHQVLIKQKKNIESIIYTVYCKILVLATAIIFIALMIIKVKNNKQKMRKNKSINNFQQEYLNT